MIFRNFFEDFHAKISRVNTEAEHLLDNKCLNPTLERCLTVCDTVTVLLGDIVLLAFEKILDLFFWVQKNCIFTTAQISVYNCKNFFTTAQSVHNCTLKKP